MILPTAAIMPRRVGIEAVWYSLAHVPDLVRYGSKPCRELRTRPDLADALARQLRTFAAATAYAPHQVFIGNMAPRRLGEISKPWHENLLENAPDRGRFGDLIDEESFYRQMACADRFKLVSLEKSWCGFEDAAARPARTATLAEIEARCARGSLPLYAGTRLVGSIDAAHDEDPNLIADVLLENLAAKASAAHALRSLLQERRIDPCEIDYVISCSEEAVGDRYNRGGGNLAKAIAEECSCENASGSDSKAFCAGPMYAMVHGASLIEAGVAQKVAVVAGGSLAKLGMKFESHLKSQMPILEDVLGSCAVVLTSAKAGQPCIRLDSVAFHPVRAGAAPQAMAEWLVEKPLAKLGLSLMDIDRYGVELHNPEITVPSGSGDVPRANYLTLAALAVMRGQLEKSQMEDFVCSRGMPGYAPTQGHIPSAIAFLGHAVESLRTGEIRRALLIAKGSLFLGRMTQLSDGCSFLIDRNDI